jgi:transposase
MAQRFVSADRDQEFLLAPSLRDWLPAGHLAWFVLDAVEQLDLAAFYGEYRADGQGRPAHDPGVMVALLLFSYAVGVRSSRQIERRCVEDVPTRVIAANLTPDHATIARFRARHEQALGDLFGQVLGLCAKAGLLRAGTIAVDGTKLHANASLGANRTVEGLREDARRAVAGAGEIDAREDRLFGQARGDELPGELADPATRAGRIKQLLDELEGERAAAQAAQDAKVDAYEAKVAAGRRPTGKPPGRELPSKVERGLPKKVNLTDPDSRIVSDKGALAQGFNVQAAVADGQIVVAVTIAQDANDKRQLQPVVDAAQRELKAAGVEQAIGEVLADTGYWNAEQMDALGDQGITTIIAPTAGRNEISPRKNKPPQGPHADRIGALLATDDGKGLYAKRKQIVEPVFAHIKHLRGITRFSRRGRQAVQAEWQLIAATHNLLKLHRSPLAAN